MSKVVKIVEGVECMSDHEWGKPCDGHTIKLIYNLSSDTTSLEINDQHIFTLDDALYEAFIKLENGGTL